MNLKKYFARSIASTSLFWKFRHLYDSNWYEGYSKKENDFYLDFLKKNKIKSVLDFGCASGANLFSLKSNYKDLIVCGVDISKRAIDFCNDRFEIASFDSFGFFQYLHPTAINAFLRENKINYFGLTIFDRVFVCMSENEIHQTINFLKDKTKLVFLDDFYLDQSHLSYKGWKHRDWVKILNNYGFELIFNKETIYDKVNDSNPRSMLFSKEIKT